MSSAGESAAEYMERMAAYWEAQPAGRIRGERVASIKICYERLIRALNACGESAQADALARYNKSLHIRTEDEHAVESEFLANVVFSLIKYSTFTGQEIQKMLAYTDDETAEKRIRAFIESHQD